TASYTCGGATLTVLNNLTLHGALPSSFTETVTWDASDCSGNHSVTRSQTITVVDTTAPTIGAAGSDATIQCPATPVFTPPTASDTRRSARVNVSRDETT